MTIHKFDVAVLLITILTIITGTILFLANKRKIWKQDDTMDNVIKKLLNDTTNEHFTVAMANDINHYQAAVKEAKKEDDSWADKNTISDDKKYITADDFGAQNGFQTKSCSNSSINKKFKLGPTKLLPYELSCDAPNKLTAENYYKTHYLAQSVNLEDYAVRGANYMEYTNYAHPVKSNIRILSQNTKGLSPDNAEQNVPTPANYAFHGTPSMRMP